MKISLDTPANRFLFSNELFDIGFFIFQTFSKTKKTKGHFPFSSYFEQSPLVRLEFDSIMNYIESPKNKLNSLLWDIWDIFQNLSALENHVNLATSIQFTSLTIYPFNNVSSSWERFARCTSPGSNLGARTRSRFNLIDAEIATKSSSLHNGSFPFPEKPAILHVSHGEAHYHAPFDSLPSSLSLFSKSRKRFFFCSFFYFPLEFAWNGRR